MLHYIAITIPSNIDNVPRLQAQHYYTAHVAREFSRQFGGATVTHGIGYFQSQTQPSKIIEEKIDLIKCFIPDDVEIQHRAYDILLQLARFIKEDMHQECVAIETTSHGMELI